NPAEMGNRSIDEVVTRLRRDPAYREEFRIAFGGPIDATGISRAIATFERTLLSGNSPFDRFQAGEEGALSAEARRGMAIFRGRGRCSRCHTISEHQPFFTNFAYQNTGVASRHPNFESLAREAATMIEGGLPMERLTLLGSRPGGEEIGRALRSSLIFEIGSYRTPGLRNVGITAPYFHDGSARTLAEVVRFYDEGGRINLNLEEELHPLGLTSREQRDLVLFLESLTGVNPGH
ncbi:MAG: cytochrome-c peroxidase, partial [Blastocatellia bacterium]